MSFPLIPLIDAFSYLAEFNILVSFSLFVIAVLGSFCILFVNMLTDYDKVNAQGGVFFLIVAVVMWVVGIIYPIILVASILCLYILIYWIIWRFLIKNIIVAFTNKRSID